MRQVKCGQRENNKQNLDPIRVENKGLYCEHACDRLSVFDETKRNETDETKLTKRNWRNETDETGFL